MQLSSIFILVAAACMAAGGQILFKIGAQGRVHWAEFFNVYIFLGFLFYTLGALLWVYSLSSEKLVNVYAFTALTFVLVLAGAIFGLGEKVSTLGLLGIALVLGGLYLLINYNG